MKKDIEINEKLIVKPTMDCVIEAWGDPVGEVTGFFANQFTFEKVNDKYIGYDIIKQYVPHKPALSTNVNVIVEIKNAGSQRQELIKDAIVNERVDEAVDITVIDPEVYDKLETNEKNDFESMTTWEAYDLLTEYLESGEMQGTAYLQALLQIYNYQPRKTKPVQTYKTVYKTDLEDVSIDVYVNGKLYHIYEGKKIDCGDRYLRHYHFVLDKTELFKEV